jgi:hypothetical protein
MRLGESDILDRQRVTREGFFINVGGSNRVVRDCASRKDIDDDHPQADGGVSFFPGPDHPARRKVSISVERGTLNVRHTDALLAPASRAVRISRPFPRQSPAVSRPCGRDGALLPGPH